MNWIRGWAAVQKEAPEKYLIVKFEDLKKDTTATFKKVLDFYEIRLDERKIETIVENARGKGDFKTNWQAALVLPYAMGTNFRSGKVGQWKDEFSDEHIQKAKEIFGETLVELGYEKDLNW